MHFFDIILDFVQYLIPAIDTALKQVLCLLLHDRWHLILLFNLLIYMLFYLLNIMWFKISFTNNKLPISSVAEQEKWQNA